MIRQESVIEEAVVRTLKSLVDKSHSVLRSYIWPFE